MKNKTIITGVYLLSAFLFIYGPRTIFQVCKVHESPMRCYWSTRAEIGIAILLLGISAVYAAIKTEREKILISVIAIVTGTVAILIPKVLIGGCGMKTMACRSRTFPSFYAISIFIIFISLENIFYIIKRRKVSR